MNRQCPSFPAPDSLRVLQFNELEHSYKVHAKIKLALTSCIYCFNESIVKFGLRQEVFTDLPFKQKQVRIHLHRRRYYCKLCKTTFLEPVIDRDLKRRVTRRLARYIEEESKGRTYTSIACEVGLNEKTIRNISKDFYY